MVGDLLQTKLYVPRVRPSLVPRSHLIEKLNQGVQQGCKLGLISAPAGFGKTTLVSEWLVCGQRPTAWLSLDEGDNDLTRFLTYLVAALQTLTLSGVGGIAGNFGEGVLAIIQSPQPVPTESILTALLNEITIIPDNFVLVLDDYHVIDAKPIDNALSFLIEHMPLQMHLVIATREDPNLPLARYRAQSQLTELRASNLRFASSEAAEFLNQVMGLNLSAEEVNSLKTRTEGWIAGLQLAALSMREREDVPGFIRAFAGDNRYIVDYLVEEVLQRQPERVRSFLLQTAVLNRLTGSLCDTVTSQDNGQATLEMLDRANLFIVPLDGVRQWYRYHHLFTDLLRQRLGQTHLEQMPTLHSRASEWYEQNGLPSDAIHHALAAKDFERAADLAELAWPVMSGSFQSIEWLGWVKGLPNEHVRARPVLSVAYAWANLNAGKLEAAEVSLRDAEQWLEMTIDKQVRPEAALAKTCPEQSRRMVVVDQEQFQGLPVSFATARAYHAQAIGDIEGTVKYARWVLDLLPKGNHPRRGDATALLGLAQWASGNLEAAHQTLSAGLAGMEPLEVIVGTFVLADMKMTLGQLQAALSTCEHALQLATEHGEPMPLGTEDVYTGISELHRERGDLETAAQDLLAAKKLGEQVELPDWQYRWCIAQARLKETLGDLDSALDLLSEAERLYVRTPLPVVRPIAALKTRIWVKLGKMAEALSWARERSVSVDDGLSYLREFEHITLARMLIARYKSDHADHSILEAMGLLERLLKAAEEGKRMSSVIEILLLQALAYEAQGNIPFALVPLERALTLAAPEGYVRIFVDEGAPMAVLLQEAVKHGITPNYVNQLRAVLGTAKSQSSSMQPLIEPLSERELEVLQLIAQGCSNREISEWLFLALNTVKGHNRNIFGKLGVQRRTEAVARARELGLL